MRAELISTGTELLLGQILNTNAQFLGRELAELGINVYFETTVGDNETRVLEALEIAMKRADLIIVTGGLGPTEDDLTKETIAKLLGRNLYLDDQALTDIRKFFDLRGVKMPESNTKQALLPEGSLIIPNKMGTAPGVILETGENTIVVLPGPPVEMQPMFNETVVPFINKRTGKNKSVIISRVLKILGIGESSVEEQIKDLVENQTNPTIAFLAPCGEVYVRLTAKTSTKTEAAGIIKGVEKEIRRRFGDNIYGTDDETLETAVADLLKNRGLTLSAAESCTGGLIAQRLTGVPGVSENFMYSLVTYSNEAKTRFLGVSPQTLQKFGAVSEETALEMVKGVRQAGGTDLAVAVTGIAGPGGGTPDKPVGLVYVGCADHDTAIVQPYLFAGDREVIRWQTANAALNMLRKYLLKYKR